ncbi:hypothetical protein SDC9_140289 [bioreactor metagenome]|uniref:Uncharacterized protein n=1 Tax=bioreactor metagenome TaxID=1076179 RepID=A0A645DX21_9ZZZZ
MSYKTFYILFFVPQFFSVPYIIAILLFFSVVLIFPLPRDFFQSFYTLRYFLVYAVYIFIPEQCLYLLDSFFFIFDPIDFFPNLVENLLYFIFHSFSVVFLMPQKFNFSASLMQILFHII